MNTSLPPELKRFIDKKLKGGRYLSADELVVDALRRYKEWDDLRSQHKTNLFEQARELVDANYPNLGCTGTHGDLQAVAFLVLMETAKGAREDLKNIMAHSKTINTARQNLREMITKVNKDIAANIGQNNGKAPLDFSNGFGKSRAGGLLNSDTRDLDIYIPWQSGHFNGLASRRILLRRNGHRCH